MPWKTMEVREQWVRFVAGWPSLPRFLRRLGMFNPRSVQIAPRVSTKKFLYPASSTVSFSPTALVTATSVESRGFPRRDKARYKLSRSIPAALATLAMPPRASEMRRRAIRSTPGSSSSSNAPGDTRPQTLDSLAVPESQPLCEICSPCVSLVSFLVVVQVFQRASDVGRLFALLSSAKQQDASFGYRRVINPIARSPVDA
jgi:hypothetical protein